MKNGDCDKLLIHFLHLSIHIFAQRSIVALVNKFCSLPSHFIYTRLQHVVRKFTSGLLTNQMSH